MLNFLSLFVMLPQVSDEPGPSAPKRRAVEEVVEETKNEETETKRIERERRLVRTGNSKPLSYLVQVNIIKYMDSSTIVGVSTRSEEFLRLAKSLKVIELHTVNFSDTGVVLEFNNDSSLKCNLDMKEVSKMIKAAKRLRPNNSKNVVKFVIDIINMPTLMEYIETVGNEDIDRLVIENPTGNLACNREKFAKMLGPLKYLQLPEHLHYRTLRCLCQPPKEVVFDFCSLSQSCLLELKSPKIVVHNHRMDEHEMIVIKWLERRIEELKELHIRVGGSQETIERILMNRPEKQRERRTIKYGTTVMEGHYFVRADSARAFVGFEGANRFEYMHILVNPRKRTI